MTLVTLPGGETIWYKITGGGDPLLSTFVSYPEGDLARLIFHELAHQVVYVQDDTPFNESFATAVERLGSARWLDSHGSPEARADYATFRERRQQFRTLTLGLRRELSAIYTQKQGFALSAPDKSAMKSVALRAFHSRYAELKTAWGGYAGYDAWVARTNNASLAALAAYDDLVPGFEALFARQDQDWHRFYDAVRKLAALSREQRREALSTTPNNNQKEAPHG